MLTRQSLFVSFALILALVCTGLVAASAHAVQPIQAQQNARGTISYPRGGVAAIAVSPHSHHLLSLLDVRHYVHTRGFVGGPTLNGKPPVIRTLQLIDVLHLDQLLHFLLPEQPGNKLVYYIHLGGPLLVLPDLPLPILRTLIPDLSNVPAFISHLGSLPGLNLLNTNTLANLLHLPGRMPDLSHLQSNSVHSKPMALASAYEVFDAHTGNLLAWG